MVGFAELAFAEIVERVAAVDPTPGAGPSLAWTCALAAALVEMVSAVSLGQQPADPGQ
ncbi:MAG: cyclodeaminase/cyclohydrolase family protein [Solirubrobacteraceae bacterium]